MEWVKPSFKANQLRIAKHFAFLPKDCQQDIRVWLDSYYEFQESYYHYDGFSHVAAWHTLTTLSASQFKIFKKEVALNLTAPEPTIRKFAELVKE